MVKFNSFHETVDDRLFERLVERFWKVCVEVIKNYVDFLCVFVPGKFADPFDFFGKVLLGSSVCDSHFSMAAFRFHGKKDVLRAVAFVFVVAPSRYAGAHTKQCPCVTQQLLALFIKTDDRFILIVGQRVEVKHVFHVFNKLLIDLWDAPHFFPATAVYRDTPVFLR